MDPPIPGGGYDIVLDELSITDSHPDPIPALITAVPNQAEPGAYLQGVRFESREPLFEDPGATIFLGPGFLIENFRVISPTVAVADVRVSERVFPIDHALVLDTPDVVQVGTFDITSCGPLGCLRPNGLPSGTLELDQESIAANTDFPVALQFDDPDGDFVQAEIAIESMATGYIVFDSPFRTYRTDLSDRSAETLTASVPGLPAGEYLALGILNDGIGHVQTVELPFTIAP